MKSWKIFDSKIAVNTWYLTCIPFNQSSIRSLWPFHMFIIVMLNGKHNLGFFLKKQFRWAARSTSLLHSFKCPLSLEHVFCNEGLSKMTIIRVQYVIQLEMMCLGKTKQLYHPCNQARAFLNILLFIFILGCHLLLLF